MQNCSQWVFAFLQISYCTPENSSIAITLFLKEWFLVIQATDIKAF